MADNFVTRIGSIIEINQNSLTINLPKDLKIKINGNLDLLLSSDLDIETDGEINILSKDHDIHIDSLNSILWLNSQRCKQIRNDLDVVQQCEEQTKNIAVNNISQHHSCQHFVELYQILGELNKRIEFLEEQINKVINVK